MKRYKALVALWGARGKVIEPGTVVDTIPPPAAAILLARGMIEEVGTAPETAPETGALSVGGTGATSVGETGAWSDAHSTIEPEYEVVYVDES